MKDFDNISELEDQVHLNLVTKDAFDHMVTQLVRKQRRCQQELADLQRGIKRLNEEQVLLEHRMDAMLDQLEGPQATHAQSGRFQKQR